MKHYFQSLTFGDNYLSNKDKFNYDTISLVSKTLPFRCVFDQGKKCFEIDVFGEEREGIILCKTHVQFLGSQELLKVLHPIKLQNRRHQSDVTGILHYMV